MKKIIITTLILMAGIASAAEVNLNIDYNVDGVPFEFDKEYESKDGIKYKISRFEYYMCQFKLDDTLLEGTYVLANAGIESYSLGNMDISNVDNISLSFGVEEEENIGKDPNRFGMFHPLAPKNPSMHWGWSAGYRFWAIEGFSDPDGDGVFDKSFQYHILGDEAFRTLSFTVNAQEVDGKIDIMLDFDIQEILAPVDMTTFGIYHEFYNNSQEVRDLIDNFGESDVVTSETTTSVELSQSISISPNPTTDYLNVNMEYVNSDFEIVSLNGNVVQTGAVNSNIIEINDLTSGTYFLRLFDNSGVIKTAKFVKK